MKHHVLRLLLALLAFCACDSVLSDRLANEAIQLEKQGRYKEAILLLDKAIKRNPKNIDALINRGVDRSLLEDYKGAISDYSRVIELDSSNTLAYLNRAKNKRRLENYAGALADLEQAITIKGGEIVSITWNDNVMLDKGAEYDVPMEEIRYERGITRFEIDSLRLAFDDFNFCVTTEYEAPASLYYRGLIYLSFEMENEACQDFQEANKLEPNQENSKWIDQNCNSNED